MTSDLTSGRQSTGADGDARPSSDEAQPDDEHRFRALADAMPQLVWIANADGVLEYFNARIREYHGAARLPDGTWHWDPMVHPDDYEHTAATWRHAIATGSDHVCEHRVRMADGSYRWHITRARLVREKGFQRWFGTATDIHEQKLVEEELRRSETRFKRLFDTNQLGIIFCDTTGRISDANDEFLRIVGYDRDDLRAGRIDWAKMTPPEHLPGDVRAIEQLHQRGSTDPWEKEYLRKDGSRVWVLVGGATTEGEEVISFVIDISRRKTIESELERLASVEASRASASEERFRLLVESVVDYGIFMVDPNGIITSWNRGAERISGYRADEVIGSHFGRFYLDEDARAGKCERELEIAAALGRFEEESWRVRKDGSRYWASVSVAALREDGVLVGFVKLIRDRTERRRAEEDRVARLVAERANEILRESEERFRAIFENAAVGIALLELDGTWVRVNDTLCRSVGYSRDELAKTSFQALTHPDDLERDLAQAKRLLAGEIDTYSMEKRYFRKDGQIVWVNLTVSLLRDATGAPAFFVSVIEDISERMRIEAERQRLHAELAQTVQFAEQFVGILGHDLRNPLNAIQMGATMLKQRVPERESVDLAEVVSSVVEELRVVHPRREIRCQLASGVRGSWDPHRLAQVVSNLVGNALQYGDEARAIDVRLCRVADGVELAVHSVGPPIDAELMPVIFEPYRRGGNDNRTQGLGLGLYITRQIVLAHGGPSRSAPATRKAPRSR